MSDRYATIDFESRDGVARLTLARPTVGNAIDLPMALELADAARRCVTDPSLRVLVLKGRGAHFCVGGDLRENLNSGIPADQYTRQITVALHRALEDFAGLSAVMVAAVHGVTAGAGFGFALLSDLVVAPASARFLTAYTKVSLTPDAGVSFMLPRAIGVQRALDMLLVNRPCDAAEAHALGMVSRLVPEEALDAATEELVGTLLAGPVRAFGVTKKLVRRDLAEYVAHMELESRMITEQVATPEGAAGMEAFMRKFGAKQRGTT